MHNLSGAVVDLRRMDQQRALDTPSTRSLISQRLDLAHKLLESMDWIDAPSQHIIEQFRQIYPHLPIALCQLPMQKMTDTVQL